MLSSLSRKLSVEKIVSPTDILSRYLGTATVSGFSYYSPVVTCL